MNNGDAAALVSALETISRISTEESSHLVRSRERAIQLGQLFEDRLKQKIAEPAQSHPLQLESMTETMMSSVAEMASQRSRTALRELSFLEAFHALMRLYATEATRHSAEAIFGLLQQMRMIDVGEDDVDMALEMPAMEPAADVDASAGKDAMLQSVQEFHERLRSRTERRMANYDKRIEASKTLLDQTSAIAPLSYCRANPAPLTTVPRRS